MKDSQILNTLRGGPSGELASEAYEKDIIFRA